jgi:hypothetical protein
MRALAEADMSVVHSFGSQRIANSCLRRSRLATADGRLLNTRHAAKALSAKVTVATSETTSMAHFIDNATLELLANVLVHASARSQVHR